MKISSHEICTNTHREYQTKQKINSELDLIIPKRRNFLGLNMDQGSTDHTSISFAAKNKYLASSSFQMDRAVEISKSSVNPCSGNGEKQLISRLVSHAAGGNAVFTQEDVLVNVASPARQNSGFLFPPRDSVQLAAMTTETLHIRENTIVNTQGIIETQDGRQIKFGMHLSMERQFTSEKISLDSISTKKLVDHLIIQFEDGPSSFSDKLFSFDLLPETEPREPCTAWEKAVDFWHLIKTEADRLTMGQNYLEPVQETGLPTLPSMMKTETDGLMKTTAFSANSLSGVQKLTVRKDTQKDCLIPMWVLFFWARYKAPIPSRRKREISKESLNPLECLSEKSEKPAMYFRWTWQKQAIPLKNLQKFLT